MFSFKLEWSSSFDKCSKPCNAVGLAFGAAGIESIIKEVVASVWSVVFVILEKDVFESFCSSFNKFSKSINVSLFPFCKSLVSNELKGVRKIELKFVLSEGSTRALSIVGTEPEGKIRLGIFNCATN